MQYSRMSTCQTDDDEVRRAAIAMGDRADHAQHPALLTDRPAIAKLAEGAPQVEPVIGIGAVQRVVQCAARTRRDVLQVVECPGCTE